MKNTIKVLLISLVSLVSATASAAPIDGSLALGGAYQITTDGTGAAVIILDTVYYSEASGDMIGTVNIETSSIGTGGSANLDGLTPAESFFTVDPWRFDLTTLNIIDDPTKKYLTLNGSGYLFMAGEAAGHAANWSFSAQSATSYSMTTTTVVPVPAAVWLFGTGLLGLVGVARRKA